MMDLKSKLYDYVRRFSEEDAFAEPKDTMHSIEWMAENIPLFECADKEIEEIYYFRWWILQKHIKHTPEGYIITEFQPDVPWAGAYNSINCALGFHVREARWLRNRHRYLPDELRFWLGGSGDVQSYSCWIGQSVLDACAATLDRALAVELLSPLVAFYEQREKTHLHSSGLFWSCDDRDAMEYSISGDGLRPTLNSYMYANAKSISIIARWAHMDALSNLYEAKAKSLQGTMRRMLWDEQDGFYKALPLRSAREPLLYHKPCEVPKEHNVMEEIGFIPWCFDIPTAAQSIAFNRLKESACFQAPYGPTTADQSHPRYQYPADHECLWNGPSWPFATSQTLLAAEHLLHRYSPCDFNQQDYMKLLKTYAHSHHRTLPDGRVVCWIDENLDPMTGEWLSRRILESQGWPKEIGGFERGKDYNHSGYCDMIITGLCGVRLDKEDLLSVQPLADGLPFFRLEGLPVGEHLLSVQYDADGTQYDQVGLCVKLDGRSVPADKVLLS
ncbi:MAG: trehalase family glycosidase [Eubacteriales bacterium]|nr:trehalase family glycosidase [Eubacteriales bacterium]